MTKDPSDSCHEAVIHGASLLGGCNRFGLTLIELSIALEMAKIAGIYDGNLR